ncbi:MAG: hypothetical protein H7249_02195 [Chitinophagaceae bacterium]|nr:hypothetical protein [Oligoflexus sp.]
MKPLIAIVLFASLVTTSCKSINKPNSETSFDGGEHKVLGDTGYKQACSEYGTVCPALIYRADRKDSFSYGELVAFSGDFYGTPEEIITQTRNQSFLHPFSPNDKRVKGYFEKEEAAILKQMSDPNVSYPDYNLGFGFSFPKYLELSTTNYNHFGWFNMVFYVKYHGRALALAVQAHDETDAKKKDSLLNQALIVNAFSDHFLTDGFATGHIRNPRTQAVEWQKKYKYNKIAVDALAKLMHDHDHLLKDSHGPGLAVKNTRGDQWHTRCDGELFVLATAQSPQVAIPIESVARSVKELMTAYREGQTPIGLYSATELVPFLDTTETALVDVFKPDIPHDQIIAWLKSLGILYKAGIFYDLNESMARTFFAALPGIMDNFRAEVTKEAQDPEIAKRLPDAYIKGFETIR